ncbi:MAG: DUF3641 domain-containing protein [Coriobacteriia bacterium]|nr:DUF3641 domain-containing protein [Coriobacteriia bacterium]
MNAFSRQIAATDAAALRAISLDVLQVNVGLRCNMACAHCHQSCSPWRDEMMRAETLEAVLCVAREVKPRLMDVTGGAPELHPDIRRFVSDVRSSGIEVQLRTNLTALLEPEADGLAKFLAGQRVRLLASLPTTDPIAYASQRCAPIERAIESLWVLSELGYGRSDELRLDIAVNPTEARLPRAPSAVSSQLERTLTDGLDVPFDNAVVITNMPVGRFRTRLLEAGMLEAYVSSLRGAFNAEAVPVLACRTGLSIGWDGTFSDCDFNLAAGLATSQDAPQHIADFDAGSLAKRKIRFGEHCYACTASAGSS